MLIEEQERKSDPCYLGIYAAKKWPFSRRTQRELAHDAANFFNAVAEAWAGAGFRTVGPWARPDPATEKAAVNFVTRRLCNAGYTVKSRERVICGYDLHAQRGNEELHVEVKGCKSADARFFISRTEINASVRDPSWRLALVTGAGTDNPECTRLMTGNAMRRRFTLSPTAWEATRVSR